MAVALLDTVLGRLADEENGTKAYEILETYKGKDLEYKEYEPLYQCAYDCASKQNKKAFFVTCDTYVTLTDGTGVFISLLRLVKTMPRSDVDMICRSFSW